MRVLILLLVLAGLALPASAQDQATQLAEASTRITQALNLYAQAAESIRSQMTPQQKLGQRCSSPLRWRLRTTLCRCLACVSCNNCLSPRQLINKGLSRHSFSNTVRATPSRSQTYPSHCPYCPRVWRSRRTS